MITTIAFDADDTLWHNERIFITAKTRYKALLARYHEPQWIEDRLDETEMRNIKHFGYGVKGFTLSMVETAVELTEGRVKGSEIGEIIKISRTMLSTPIELLEGVSETIGDLQSRFRLIVITKGDLFDQETKIARSGLGDYFEHVEVVSAKTQETYRSFLLRSGLVPEEFVMIGNSLKSDILPVLEIGSNAVHVPYETEWVHERVKDRELSKFDFPSLSSISEVTAWLDSVS
jgi:putative hydrolase of the HAD superfamily